MKTIKFILNDDGSIASSSIGFQINQYSYNDTLINVYVPTEILNTQTDTATYHYGNNIVMAMYYTLGGGSQRLGNPYYFTFVKNNVVIEGKSYTLFERKMPKEFTLYYGTQNYALNVILTRTNISVFPITNEIIGNITSATFELLINQGLNMADNPIEVDTDLSTLISNVNTLMSDMLDKQDKQDGLIQVKIANGSGTTTDVVNDALNDLDSRVSENYNDNISQGNDITILQGKVSTLEQEIITGFRYVGTITSNNAPDSTSLTYYVETTQGLTLTNGDTVIWIQIISGATDKSYRCIYGYSGWSWSEIPAVELASNTDAGLIIGQLSGGTQNVYASIVGGKIVDLFYNNGNNTFTSITQIGTNKTTIQNIINGNQVVGKSTYATYDSTEESKVNKTTIDNKFLTKTDGASKTYVKSYALPREFNDVYRLDLNQNIYEVNADLSTTPYKNVATDLGEVSIVSADLNVNNYEYQLSSKNSFRNDFYVSFANAIDNVIFKLVITYTDTNNTTTTVATTMSDSIDFDTNIKKIIIADYFNDLGNTILDIEDSGIYQITLSAIFDTSTPNTLTLYSSDTYPSAFTFSTNGYTICTSESGIIYHTKTGTYDNQTNTLTFDFGNEILADKSQHMFALQYANDGTIPENAQVEIVFDNNAITISFIGNENTLLCDFEYFRHEWGIIVFEATYIDNNGNPFFNINNVNTRDFYYFVDGSLITAQTGYYDLDFDTMNELMQSSISRTLIFNGSDIGLGLDAITLNTVGSYNPSLDETIYYYGGITYDNNSCGLFTIKIVFDWNNGTCKLYSSTKTLPTLSDDNTFTGTNTFDEINTGNINMTSGSDLTASGCTIYAQDVYASGEILVDNIDGYTSSGVVDIGNTSGDYWEFDNDILKLKGTSHYIRTNDNLGEICLDDSSGTKGYVILSAIDGGSNYSSSLTVTNNQIEMELSEDGVGTNDVTITRTRADFDMPIYVANNKVLDESDLLTDAEMTTLISEVFD